MTALPWWKTISTAELLDLRRRLLGHLQVQFGSTLKGELEDVVQHAFAVLFGRRESVKADNDGLYRYLKTVSQHKAVDGIRAARRQRAHDSELISERERRAPMWGAHGIPSEQLAKESEKIWQVFCALDDLDRLIIWSHVVDGKSIRAIARDLDLNWHRVAGIVEGTLRRVRGQLKALELRLANQ